jgi:hypothetical protein
MFLLFLYSCDGTKKRSTERENSLLKQAAYSYNFEYVKRKTAVHELCNDWSGMMHDSVVSSVDYLNNVSISKYHLDLDSNLSLDTLGNEFLVTTDLITSEIDNLLTKEKGLIRAYIVSLEGWFTTIPSIDTAIYPITSERLRDFFSFEMLDTNLSNYGLWYEDVVVDPLIGIEVRSYRQALEVDGNLMGWIIVQASTISDLELLNSFGTDFIIADYNGKVFYADEEAATRLALPIVSLESTLNNHLSINRSSQQLSIDQTRIPGAKTALSRIFEESAEKEEFMNQRKQIMLLATDMSEIRCKLIKVFEH